MNTVQSVLSKPVSCDAIYSFLPEYLFTMVTSANKNSPCSFLYENILGNQTIPHSLYWDK